jgi:signal peptide peptidase SppA
MKRISVASAQAITAAGAGEVREQRAFDKTGALAIEPEALTILFDPFEDEDEDEVERVGDMAVVEIEGPLMQSDDWWFDSYEAIRERCDKAMASDAPTVCLKINSPGGMVAGLYELCDHITKRKTESGKTLVAYVDGTACSAAYALACTADAIYCPETGRVGSVGVILSVTSFAEAYAAMGIKTVVVASGARKADGHPKTPITEDAIKSFQADVDQLATIFFDRVAAWRGLKAADVKAMDAAVFIGAKAKDKGLCDVVGSFDDVVSKYGGAVVSDGSGASAEGNSAAAVATENKEVRLMDQAIMEALGLPGDAKDTAVLAAATKLSAEHKELLGLIGAENIDQAKGAVAAWKLNSAALEKASKELADVKAEREAKDRAELMSALSAKLTPAEMEANASEFAAMSVDTLRVVARVAKPTGATPSDVLPKEPAAPTVRLTESQRRAAASAGIPEDKFAAQLAELAKEGA